MNAPLFNGKAALRFARSARRFIFAMSSLLSKFEATESQRLEVVSLLDGLSESQRAYKQNPAEWSPSQIAEHLMLSYETVGSREWAKANRANGKAPRPHPLLLRLILWAIRSDVRLPLPSTAVEPSGAIAWPQLKERFESASQAMRASVESPDAARETNRPFAHPVIGALNTREMLELNHVHNGYHLRQLKSLLRALPQASPTP